MKKLFIIFGLILASLSGLNAQTVTVDLGDRIFDNPDNRPYLGVRLGLDIMTPGDVSADNVHVGLYKPGAGFDAGAIYNIPLWKNLYFEPGLSLYYNSIGASKDFLESGESMSMRRFGFRIPMQFGYHFDFNDISVAVFTGPQMIVGLSGRFCYKDRRMSYSENLYDTELHDSWRRFDLGWKFGAQVTFASRYVAGISGTAGMLNMYREEGISYHDNNVTIFIGYNF